MGISQNVTKECIGFPGFCFKIGGGTGLRQLSHTREGNKKPNVRAAEEI